MSRVCISALFLVATIAAQSPSNPTNTSLTGIYIGNNPDCNGSPAAWQWLLPPNACQNASVLGILGHRQLLPAQRPFSYVTGHTDPTTGREIALLSALNGLVIIDAHVISETGPTLHLPQHILNPDPVLSIHRGSAAFGEYLYESNLLRPTLRVMHLAVNPVANPVMTLTNLPSVPLPTGASYRLTVDKQRGHLYVPTPAGLHIYDINGIHGAAPLLLAVWRGWLWPGATIPSFDVHVHSDKATGTLRAIVSQYLGNTGTTHISILDVTNLPNGSPAIDPWTPPNWVAFNGQVGASAAHSTWMDNDGRFLYSSVGDVATAVYDMRQFGLWNVNRTLLYVEFPPLMLQAGTNPPVPLVYPEAPVRQMGMAGLGMTGYASAWREGFRLYDLRPGNLNPNEVLASVDTSRLSFYQPYGGAFAVYREQDSGVIYVGDTDYGIYFVRLNVAHMHRYGRGTPAFVGNQPLIPRITMATAPPRAHSAGAPDPEQKVTISNLVPGRAIILIPATDGKMTGTPFPNPGSACMHYLDGIIIAPIFTTANALGKAEVTIPPGLPAQLRLFMQAFSFVPSSILCEASSRGTWFGLAEHR